jgi:rubrerythrin
LPCSAREALEVALAAEERAFEFYANAIPLLDDGGVRRFFEEMMQEEIEHQPSSLLPHRW